MNIYVFARGLSGLNGSSSKGKAKASPYCLPVQACSLNRNVLQLATFWKYSWPYLILQNNVKVPLVPKLHRLCQLGNGRIYVLFGIGVFELGIFPNFRPTNSFDSYHIL